MDKRSPCVARNGPELTRFFSLDEIIACYFRLWCHYWIRRCKLLIFHPLRIRTNTTFLACTVGRHSYPESYRPSSLASRTSALWSFAFYFRQFRSRKRNGKLHARRSSSRGDADSSQFSFSVSFTFNHQPFFVSFSALTTKFRPKGSLRCTIIRPRNFDRFPQARNHSGRSSSWFYLRKWRFESSFLHRSCYYRSP